MALRIPTLETERLFIRELVLDDLVAINRVTNAVHGDDLPLAAQERWLQWTVLGYEQFANLEQPHYGERAITLKETSDLIGMIGVVPYVASFGQIAAFKSRPGPATAEVGLFWMVAPAHQRQGYTTEAAKALVYYLRRYLRLARIIATTGYGNEASQAVMRNIGMDVEHARWPQPPDIFVVGVLDNLSDWRSQFQAAIRHPTEAQLYLREWRSGWGLPRAQVATYVWNGHTDIICANLQKHLGGEVWLHRQLYYAEDEGKKRIQGVSEIALAGRLKGGEWVDRQRLASLPLREEHLRPVLDGYLQELESSIIPSQRPAWAIPGWRAEVVDWLEQELAQLGFKLVFIEQVKHWCLSSVLKVKTDGRHFYFKVPAALPLFIHEAGVTQKLAERFPAHVPVPIAVDHERGWMLFGHFGETFSWSTPPQIRQEALRRFAYLQRDAAALVDELLADGLLDRRLALLEAQIAPLLNDPDAVAELTPEEKVELHAQIPTLQALCRRLATYNIPQTPVHCDLHVGNAARTQDDVIIFFDWTDACISHPFFDLLSLRWEVNEFERAAVLAAYLEAWQGLESDVRLQEAVAIANVLLPVHHAISVHAQRANVEPASKSEITPPADFLRELLPNLEQSPGSRRCDGTSIGAPAASVVSYLLFV